MAERLQDRAGCLMGLLFLKGGKPNTIWSLDPELMIKGFFQEDVAVGVLPTTNTWPMRGVHTAATSTATPPTRLSNNGGVLFAKGTQEQVTWPTDIVAARSHRWCLCVARCDGSNNTGVTSVNVAWVNGTTSGSKYRQPRIYFNPSTAEMNAQIYAGGGLRTETGACSNVYATWNIGLWHRRGDMQQGVFNGVKTAGQTILGMEGALHVEPSFLGGYTGNLGADVAIDCIIFGQTELTDVQIDKLVWWAHQRVGKALPSGHPYEFVPPVIDANDAVSVYAFDQTEFSAWAAIGNERFDHRGEAAPAITGFSTVFFEDFVAAVNPVQDDLTGVAGSSLFAPFLPTTYGVDALIRRVSDTTAYAYNSSGVGTLSLVMYDNGGGSWRVGSFATVDANGRGRSWTTGIFEMRFKIIAFDGATPVDMAQPEDVPGIWWANPWFYSKDRNFRLTRNSIELDVLEQSGLDGRYINTTVHVHNPEIAYTHPDVRATDTSDKFAAYYMYPATDADFPGTIDILDGAYHESYVRIDADWTYIVVDGREIVRVPTTPELLQPKFLIVNLQLAIASQGERAPLTTETFHMVVDWVKVRQLETDLAVVPTGFSARPTIAGSTAPSGDLTATPNTTASHIQHRWYRDGVPVPAFVGATYTKSAADTGHKIRYHSKALSLLNQPEAWSAETATIT